MPRRLRKGDSRLVDVPVVCVVQLWVKLDPATIEDGDLAGVAEEEAWEILESMEQETDARDAHMLIRGVRHGNPSVAAVKAMLPAKKRRG